MDRPWWDIAMGGGTLVLSLAILGLASLAVGAWALTGGPGPNLIRAIGALTLGAVLLVSALRIVKGA